MTSYTIEKSTDLPVVIVTYQRAFGSAEDIAAYVEDIRHFYDGLDEPVYMIVDTTDMNLNFDGIMEFIRIGVKSDRSIIRHPNNLGIMIVTHSRFYQLAAKGLNTASFGNINFEVFDNVEAALNRISNKIA